MWKLRAAMALTVGFATLTVAAPALAAMPGMNGKIAFVREQPDTTGEIWTMNADGTGETRLTNDADYDGDPAWSPDGSRLTYSCFNFADLCLRKADGTQLPSYWGTSQELFGPTWSPDGSRVAFESLELYCEDSGDCYYVSDIAKVSLNGTGFQNLTGPNINAESTPSWSSRGDKIAFWTTGGIATVRPDGTGRAPLGVCCNQPDWSPDGTKIAYSRSPGGIYVANADGGGEAPLTTGGGPAWSPDGQKLAFVSSEDGDPEIFVINANGSERTQITHNSAADYAADWQPLPYPGYGRPKGATPIVAPLVPAYKACTASNRTHGPSLAFPSCTPPQQTSAQLTVGTPDANGQAAKSTGSVSLYTRLGDPTTPADEADVAVTVDITDVRNAGNLSDHTGTLELRLGLRLTDKGPDVATMQDTTLSVPVPCGATSDTTIGGRCSVTTTADAVVPGSVPERVRSLWQLGQLRVYDGNGSVFVTQGLFVP